METLYTARMSAEGGRDGQVISEDERFELNLSQPESLGGDGGRGTNPEELFAAAFAACFDASLHFGSQREGLPIANSKVTVEVSLRADADRQLHLAVQLEVFLPGISEDQALLLINAAHQRCPYSLATLGNIALTMTLVVASVGCSKTLDNQCTNEFPITFKVKGPISHDEA